MIFSLVASAGACGGTSDDEPGGDGPSRAMTVGRLSLEPPDDVAAPPSDAEVTSSGLASRVIEAGSGERAPFPTDTVRVYYAGWFPDGELFDYSRRGPSTFTVGGVIEGWTEGLQLMLVGEVRRFWIPSELAYGDNPREGFPAGPLVFDVELLDIVAP